MFCVLYSLLIVDLTILVLASQRSFTSSSTFDTSLRLSWVCPHHLGVGVQKYAKNRKQIFVLRHGTCTSDSRVIYKTFSDLAKSYWVSKETWCPFNLQCMLAFKATAYALKLPYLTSMSWKVLSVGVFNVFNAASGGRRFSSHSKCLPPWTLH